MLCEVLISRIELRFITAGLTDARLKIIGHDQFADAPKEMEGPLVGPDPVREALAKSRLGIGVVAGAKDGHEDLRFIDLTRSRIGHIHTLAAVVYE